MGHYEADHLCPQPPPRSVPSASPCAPFADLRATPLLAAEVSVVGLAKPLASGESALHREAPPTGGQGPDSREGRSTPNMFTLCEPILKWIPITHQRLRR